MIGITVLGATGSIGKSTLDVISRHPDKYRAVALTANTRVNEMLRLCEHYRPLLAVMANETAANQLRQLLADKQINSIEVMHSQAGLVAAAEMSEARYVMAAIVGAAGLQPCLAAARKGKRVLLANKEALVMSGRLFMNEIKANKAELLPIDSEHNAIFQCMPALDGELSQLGVRRILLTASGGPFRTWSLEDIAHVTPAQAVAHPNWSMGQKISVDSASMMNKGLEVIEAHWLFNASAEQIQVLVHPQSVIHSMVEYNDGSVLAQLGNPDMRTPIAHAMAWPDRIESGVASLDLLATARLDFEQADMERFPCLALAFECLRAQGTASTLLNAANEVAVAAFLNETIRFVDIPNIINQTLDALENKPADSLEQILDQDRQARCYAESLVEKLGG